MSPLLLIILIGLAILFLGGGYGYRTGYWGGTPNYGYGNGGIGLGTVLIIILVVLFLTGRI
jgi:hypothetical protein